MCCSLRTVLVLSLSLAVIGCSPSPQPVEPEPSPLTAEVAKQAILDINWSEVDFTLIRHLRPEDPIEVVDADEFKAGDWTCDLNKMTFLARTIYPNADHHRLNEVEGVFERDARGCWLAKVTRTLR